MGKTFSLKWKLRQNKTISLTHKNLTADFVEEKNTKCHHNCNKVSLSTQYFQSIIFHGNNEFKYSEF